MEWNMNCSEKKTADLYEQSQSRESLKQLKLGREDYFSTLKQPYPDTSCSCKNKVTNF